MRPFPPVAIPPFLIALAIAILSLTIATQPCNAQQGPQWVHFDDSPDGTPATWEILEDDSSSQATWFTLTIHGFWIEPVYGPDQRLYQRYDFPGLGQIDAEGKPELPRFVFRVAVPSTAQELTYRSSNIIRQRVYGNVLPYPRPHPGTEDIEEEWRYDEKTYEGQAVYPPEVCHPTASLQRFWHQIVGGDLEILPVQWNPDTHELRIIEELTIAYNHEGAIINGEPMTRHRARLAGGLFNNWPIVEEHFPVDRTEYVGYYLFIYRGILGAAITPLVNQKRARGFHVTEFTTEDIGKTCDEIRAAIRGWHESLPYRGDFYVLLVGDHADLPMCGVSTTDGGIIYSDDKYGSPRDGDLTEEVFVGRLSINNAVDLSHQVTKILNYEDKWNLAGDFRGALLVAHKQDAPGRYYGNCEEIRTAIYNHPPIFLTCYGSDGDTNEDIELAIEKELGVVMYRGHGNNVGWGHWNTLEESYQVANLPDLDNGPVTPVVWSLTCLSGNMLSEDCFTEEVMRGSEDRGVAAYGATEPSGCESNNWIGKTLFKAVYDDDIVIHSHAIMLAEDRSVIETTNWNAWIYYLLGDPEMHIRRRAPAGIVLKAPATVAVCSDPPCWLDAQVLDAEGQPIPELIVSAWMPAPGPMKASTGDEVLSNRYSDESGEVHLPADPGAEGWIYLTARDDFGRVITDSVQVVTATSTPAVRAPLFLSPRPAVMSERTTFYFGRTLDSAFRLEIYDQRGRLVRRLSGGSGPDHMLWDGRDAAGKAVGSGVYLVRLITENTRLSTKVVRVR